MVAAGMAVAGMAVAGAARDGEVDGAAGVADSVGPGSGVPLLASAWSAQVTLHVGAGFRPAGAGDVCGSAADPIGKGDSTVSALGHWRTHAADYVISARGY